MKKKVLSSIITVSLLIGLFALLSLTVFAAPATPYEDPTFFIANGTGSQCIEGYGGTNTINTGVIDLWGWWSPVGSTSQHYYLWKLVPDANHEYFQIRRITSSTTFAVGNALAPSGGTVAAGTVLRLATPGAADNQWWKLERQSNNRFIITNKADPTLCIAPIGGATVNQTELHLAALTATNNVWTIAQHNPESSTRPTSSAAFPAASVAAQTGITVPVGTAASALTLPTAVTVTYANGTDGPAFVSWDTSAYNGSTAGTYNLVGTLQLNGLATQPATAVTASIAVTVEGAAGPSVTLVKAPSYTDYAIYDQLDLRGIEVKVDDGAGTVTNYGDADIALLLTKVTMDYDLNSTNGLTSAAAGVQQTTTRTVTLTFDEGITSFLVNVSRYAFENGQKLAIVTAPENPAGNGGNAEMRNFDSTYHSTFGAKTALLGADGKFIENAGWSFASGGSGHPIYTVNRNTNVDTYFGYSVRPANNGYLYLNNVGSSYYTSPTSLTGGANYLWKFIRLANGRYAFVYMGNTNNYNLAMAQTNSVGNGNTTRAYATFVEFNPVTTNQWYDLVAEYTPEGGGETYTITATAGANGSIAPSGSVSVAEGAGQTFTFTPNSGFEVDTVTVDGTAVPAAASYTFTNVTANHTINVTFKAVTSLVDQPEIEEVRIITSGMIELHWKVHTKWSGSQAAYRYSDNHPDSLSGAGSSLNFFSTQNNHNANFRVQIDGVTLAQRTGTFSPYYWHADNYLLHQVRMNQHVSTLRLNANLTSSQQTALQNGTSTLTVQIIGDVTNRAGVAADKTKVYTAIWKPYYDKQITAKTGLGIRGSQYVDMRTVQKAADITDVIMSAMPQAVVNTISSQGAFLLFGPGEHSGNIPEQRNVITYDQFNRAEGYGGTNAATSAANVERCNVSGSGNTADYYPAGYRSGYQHESILAHEFGHKIQSAFNSVFASTHPLRQEFTSAFSQVTSRVMWTAYVRDASGGSEYFATMTSVWYNGMSEGNAANCNTRDEFHRYDRRGYDFFSKLFSVDKVILSPDWANCPNTAAPTWATGNADPNTTRQTRALSATPALPGVTVPVGTPISAITLPDKVQVAFADSFSTAPLSWTSPYGLDRYPVNWDTSSYDGNTAGTYILEGTPHASYPGRYLTTGPYTTDVITNPDNVKATIEVTVESPLSIEIADVVATAGSTVDVTYKIVGNLLGYANLDVSVPYLSGIYTPKTVTPGPDLNPMYFIVNPAAKPDLMRIVFISLENIVGDGLLFTVTYQVDAAAPNTGQYPLNLEVVKLQYGIDKDTMADLKATVEPGTLLLGIMGDINGDGQITPEDAMLLLQMYVGLIPWTAHALTFGDVNGDGVIDTTDAAIILRMVVGG